MFKRLKLVSSGHQDRWTCRPTTNTAAKPEVITSHIKMVRQPCFNGCSLEPDVTKRNAPLSLSTRSADSAAQFTAVRLEVTKTRVYCIFRTSILRNPFVVMPARMVAPHCDRRALTFVAAYSSMYYVGLYRPMWSVWIVVMPNSNTCCSVLNC